MHLTVIHPFGSFKRGDKITDSKAIKDILEGKDGKPHDNVRHVVRTADAVMPKTEPEVEVKAQ